MIQTVNMVAGGNLNRELDLDDLYEELTSVEGVKAEYTDDRQWQLVVKFDNAGTVIFYRTGSYIIRGGSNTDQLKKTKQLLFDHLEKHEVVDNPDEVEYSVTNIVYTGELTEKVNLPQLTVQLGLNQTE